MRHLKNGNSSQLKFTDHEFGICILDGLDWLLDRFLPEVESLNAWAEWVKAPTDGNDTF